MCGRYALALRPSEVRHQLEQSQMPVDDAPDDESVRQSYNFCPGYHGLVYRAEDFGSVEGKSNEQSGDIKQETADDESTPVKSTSKSQYKLQAMKWGLVPFWTKRNPDYGSMLKTINCRDDSLYDDRGMWSSMKKTKRCIVVAQGFYEWLKKNGGKEKIPHFTKRKDGQLMCFAGLYDSVQFEDAEEKLYTYSIITTDSNKQLSFLHDRMPVILDNGSDAIRTWLDPKRTEWSADLQSLLKPYAGELECYPVLQDVGKVGNNSAQFIVPVDSAENKSNIANFFGNQRKAAEAKKAKRTTQAEGTVGKAEGDGCDEKEIKVEDDADEPRGTTDRVQGSEDNAPFPVPASLCPKAGGGSAGSKRERSEAGDGDTTADDRQPKRRAGSVCEPGCSPPPQKRGSTAASKKGTRSATSNGSAAGKASGTRGGGGSQKITAFFSK